MAVRRDRISISRNKGRKSEVVPATVREVEYLGTIVNVSVDAGQQGELIASVPDAVFFDNPNEIGDAVFLSWKPADAHRLAG